MERVDEWINNYVFQNKYKEYFSDNLCEVRKYIDGSIKKEELKTASYNIIGIFNKKE